MADSNGTPTTAPDPRISSRYVRWGPSHVHGVGVFAVGDFAIDNIIEVCHYKRLAAIMRHHPLLDTEGNAHLVWPRDMHGSAGKNRVHIPTGLALLYNHANDPNAHFRFDLAAKTLTVTAAQAIFNYDEVLIDYRRTHPKKVRGF